MRRFALLGAAVLAGVAALAVAPAQAHHRPGHLHGPTTSTTLAAPTTTETSVPTTTTVTIGIPNQPLGPGGTWTLEFEDTFDGASLDTTKWANPDDWGTNNTLSLAANSTVSGGVLTQQLSGTEASTRGAHLFTDPGEVGQSGTTYHFEVGDFAQARVWFPGDTGEHIYNWGGWWTSTAPPATWAISGELDIAEGIGGDLGVNYWRNVPPGSGGTPTPFGHIYPSGTWYNGWHIYGVHRKASSVDFYWDGVLVRSHATSDDNGPQLLHLSLGKGDDRTPVIGPAGAMNVDYVRAWTPA